MLKALTENIVLILMLISIITYPIPQLRLFGNIPIGIIFICYLLIIVLPKIAKGKMKVNTSRKFLLLSSYFILFSIFLTSLFSYEIRTESIINILIFIVMVFLLNIQSEHFDYSKVLFVIIISGFLLSIYGFYGYFTGNIGEEAKTEVWKNYSRYFGLHYTASTRNADVHYVAIPFLISFSYLNFSNHLSLLKRCFLIIVALLSFTGVILSFSRSAWISVTVAILYTIVVSRINFKKLNKLIILGIIGVILGSYILFKFNLTNYFLGKLISIVSPEKSKEFLIENSSNSERFDTILTSLELFFLHPLGVGLDNLRYYYPKYGLYLNHAENSYLTVLSETGIVGFIGFMIFWLYPLIKINNIIKNQETNIVFVSTLFITIYLAITFLFNTEVLNFYIWVIYSVIWSIVVNLEKNNNRNVTIHSDSSM
ncbi:O-antigen ligase family protein [Geobacillus sp. E263]|uniref:O-antigen ligase family protein n=1 Tax=Geobacillus sp. E263 TaxID=391290 RepID=UPI00117BD30C|nr:O-antigen ligase family protein [Geobacillus sp. E263]